MSQSLTWGRWFTALALVLAAIVVAWDSYPGRFAARAQTPPARGNPSAQPARDRNPRLQADDWPCFRGPTQDGVSAEKGLPLEWSDSKNLVWKTRLPGAGASSPVRFGDRIYLTCYSGYGLGQESRGRFEDLKRHVLCQSRTSGKILWDVSFQSDVNDDRYGDYTNRHGYASSTPAVDETGVYVFFGPWGARCYSHGGELKWEQSCGTNFFNYGSGASPVLFGDSVIINASIEDRALIAFDKRSGREKWRVALLGGSYSTPLLVKHKNSHELVYMLGGHADASGKVRPSGLGAVDPASGQKLWECTSVDTNLHASPVASDGIIYAVANRAVAIRTGGRGNVTDTHLLWQINQGSEVGSPVYYQGHLYWADDGIAHCVSAKTGEVVYKERLNPSSGPVYASGLVADGKIYYVSREKGTYVLAAQPRFKLLAHNTLDSDNSIFNATPAVSRGQLLLRSDKFVYCIGVK